MSKPYQSEIATLPKTISWALSVDISALVSFVCEAHGTSLITTGSGGSLSAAKLASIFHQIGAAGFSKSATPLELASLDEIDTKASFLLFSAGGANTDIRTVFERLAVKEPRRFLVLTGRKATPIAILAKRYPCCQCIELDVPGGKDGFLATNSLIAFSIVIARAYALARRCNSSFSLLQSLISEKNKWNQHVALLEEMTALLWKRRHLVVLYSPDLEAAAVDIESRFTEAALATVQIADYRHFAHGRHHWLAKRGEDCGVLGFFSPPFRQLAENTFRYFPKSIPVVPMLFHEDAFGAGVSAMLTSILLAGFAGRERHIDPGCPGVPEFGRRIYHLRWNPPAMSRLAKNVHLETGIRRKLQAVGKQSNLGPDVLTAWLQAGSAFCRRLAKQPLKALVLDYDGTVVFTERRFSPISLNVAALLIRCLRNDMFVGVASGRGKSLRETLQKAMPREFWSRIIVGYYNGSQTGLLADDSLPKALPVEDELLVLQKRLACTAALLGKVKMEARYNQLSLVPDDHFRTEELWGVVTALLGDANRHRLSVVYSGHSVDIITGNTSKRAVIDHVRKAADTQANEILCIGDKGKWPGNDSELLGQFPSLSVDEVSPDCDTCWNLAPVCCAGPNALVSYLSAIQSGKRGTKFDPTKIT
jgi:hypothetical protein